MPDRICERCGAPASVTVARVASNRGAVRPLPTEHRYCRACATAAGVPVRRRGEAPEQITEPAPTTWSDIEQHLATYEAILRDDPSLRDHVRPLVRQLRRVAARIPDPAPAAVMAAFERLSDAGTGER